ncbi:MAG: hypothetical protein RIT27_951 [Pseudomonadota bacterium]|jgi:hypothetical protein
MALKSFCRIFVLVFSFIGQTVVFAEDRAILYPPEPTGKLQEIAAYIQNINTPQIPYEDIPQPTDYFVRIAPRQYVLSADNKLLPNAILGTKPFVFMTTPEGIYGKQLLDIYLDIGYEAEDIIHWQRNVEMVAMIFKYAPPISLSKVVDGKLPENWQQFIYAPTWDNTFALFSKLAENAPIFPERKGEFMPEQLFFRSEAEKQLIFGFPEAGKQRLKTVEYNTLRTIGGTDWVYRDLLEKKLSIFEHFRGTGRTLNEIVDPRGERHQSGLLEFVAPNANLNNLPEIAVVSLGKLVISN